MAGEVLDLGDVSLVILDGIGINTHSRGVVVTTIFLALASRTSLILVFFARLALVDRRLLVLINRYIIRKNVSRFSLSEVFLLLFRKPILLKVP